MRNEAVIRDQDYSSLFSGEDLSSATADSPTYLDSIRQYLGGPDQKSGEEWEITYYDSGSSLPPRRIMEFRRIDEAERVNYLVTDFSTWYSKFHGITKVEYLGDKNILKGENEYLFLRIPDVNSNATVVSGSEFIEPVSSFDFPEISNDIQELVVNSIHENYEAGMDSNLSVNLEIAIYKWGEEFLRELYANDSKFSVDSLLAIIDTIGHIEHKSSKSYRIWLLQLYLSDPKDIIRDVASMALVNLAGRYSEPFIRGAIAQETNTALKADMELLLEDLTEV